MGFAVAASVRVGNALGAGDTQQAKLSSKVSLIWACMTHICSLTYLHHSVPKCLCIEYHAVSLMPNPAIASCFIGACLGLSKDVIGYIFTTEKYVQILTLV